MGKFLAFVGVVVAVFGYFGALLAVADSAPQQAVVELRHLHGAAGLIIFALGAVCATIEHAKKVAASSPAVPVASPPVGQGREQIEPRF